MLDIHIFLTSITANVAFSLNSCPLDSDELIAIASNYYKRFFLIERHSLSMTHHQHLLTAPHRKLMVHHCSLMVPLHNLMVHQLPLTVHQRPLMGHRRLHTGSLTRTCQCRVTVMALLPTRTELQLLPVSLRVTRTQDHSHRPTVHRPVLTELHLPTPTELRRPILMGLPLPIPTGHPQTLTGHRPITNLKVSGRRSSRGKKNGNKYGKQNPS